MNKRIAKKIEKARLTLNPRWMWGYNDQQIMAAIHIMFREQSNQRKRWKNDTDQSLYNKWDPMCGRRWRKYQSLWSTYDDIPW